MYNFNNYQQPYQTNRPVYQQAMQTPYMGLKGRPVASVEEARGSIIDFDGSIFFFPDLANKKIYTKQINPDGTATLCVYELKESPAENELPFVTRAEFEAALESLREGLVIAPVSVQSVPEPPVAKPAPAPVQLNF